MFVLFFFLLGLAAGQDFAITAAPTFLFKRQQRITDCDGTAHALWTCPNGECYWGDDGFVGCCSVSSCAPRTRCIEYDDLEDDICDHNTGGCVVCSKSESPLCVFLTNPAMKEYGYYCDTSRRTGSSSFEYDLPSGAVIRTIKDTQERPLTTQDAETYSDDTDTTTDDLTIEGDTESDTGTGTDTGATTTDADDATSSGGTTNPTATDIAVADESELTETKGKLRSAIAAAAALGAIVGTVIILAIAFIWYRKRTKRQEHPQPTSQPMVHSQPSSVPGYSHQYYETVSNPPSASVSPPNTSFGGSAAAPSPTSRADEQMPHIPELGRYRY
ncbi:hypothetical protein B0J15DRAFT_594894 [Fusarium solani]|uniref:Uncharacterized protein n=1 Tax=Fusarium solani TaxID=169388 RepID=A0A9P9KIS5_FUSSL|nr:uncharacterized protein B0J15DRAFT_594894 [Fusarium solani]KAH7258720.1 hypothetical protein B0J15DRAFT_594894 [Fusarium solani]